jgi:hypothetical protein
MTDDLCYTWRTQDQSIPATDDGHDERINALVRFIARCAAEADYHELHDLIHTDPDERNT